MRYQPKIMFASHTKVLGGPYVARGPDVAQAWTRQQLSLAVWIGNYLSKEISAKAACKMMVNMTSLDRILLLR